MTDKLIDDYISIKDLYALFNERLLTLIKNLLADKNLSIHLVDGRIKSIDSLTKKIERKDNKYESIEEVTDLIGIRIITYLENDVDDVAKLIEDEFLKDEINSIDKRRLKTDQFGYKSLHLVISLKENRSDLSEYQPYKNIKCEIQIRSVLQHAWAEIEHDLGYKVENIPDPYKRSFNRLAALLETADQEFVRLKKELNNYEKEVSTMIKDTPEDVDINAASLNVIEISNSIFIKARAIVESLNKVVSKNLNSDVSILAYSFLNIKTIKQIEDDLLKKEQNYYRFVYYRTLSTTTFTSFGGSIATNFFAQYLIMEKGGINELTKFYTELLKRQADDTVLLTIINDYEKSKKAKLKF